MKKKYKQTETALMIVLFMTFALIGTMYLENKTLYVERLIALSVLIAIDCALLMKCFSEYENEKDYY
jgi:hypothetical protein